VTVGLVSHIFGTGLKMPYCKRVKGIQPTMRKIETQMNEAITDRTDWGKDNTRVETIDGVSKVFLHGHLIAEIDDNAIILRDGGYQSNTTKSRLNAILAEHGYSGESVFQKNWTWFVRLWTGTDFTTTEFRSGMRLA